MRTLVDGLFFIAAASASRAGGAGHAKGVRQEHLPPPAHGQLSPGHGPWYVRGAEILTGVAGK